MEGGHAGSTEGWSKASCFERNRGARRYIVFNRCNTTAQWHSLCLLPAAGRQTAELAGLVTCPAQPTVTPTHHLQAWCCLFDTAQDPGAC
jgi:hypothetical protein